MGRTPRYETKEKVKIIEQYSRAERTVSELANVYGVHKSIIMKWYHQYITQGEEAFETKPRNQSYSKEFKEEVVHEYLKGLGSLESLVLKHSIHSIETLRQWVKKYNNHIELKDYDPKGEVYMIKQRKSSKEERVRIVEYCIKHGRDYRTTAEVYNASYTQVYQWVKKYEKLGEDGLEDRRGQKKSDEKLSELEKLQRENERLKQELQLRDKERILLKKVKEFERRRYSVKLNKNQNT